MIECYMIDSETLDLAGKEHHVPKKRCDSIDSFLYTKDKLNSYAAGLFMRSMTDRFGGEIEYGENGKPYVSGNPIFFNISHSGHYVVCAVSDTEVGIDIEMILDNDDLAETAMVDSELSVFQSLPKEQHDTVFCGLWTAKESIMKYLGTGLTLHPKELNVLTKDGIVRECNGLSLIPVKGPEGYGVTVCSKENIPDVKMKVLTSDELMNGQLGL